jgi:fructosamine-3-kinase
MAPTDPFPAVVAEWLAAEHGLHLQQARPVSGGCIHSAWCLTVGTAAECAPALAGDPAGSHNRMGASQRRLFAKTNRRDALPVLEAEADGLAALSLAAQGTGLSVPTPLALGVAGGHAVLLLSWFDLEGRSSASSSADWQKLGAGLAHLHRRSLEIRCTEADRPGSFGWPRDNMIGDGPQPNGWHQSWGTFFAERRLAPQLARLERRHGPLRGAEALLQSVPYWLEGHGADPCLVHGDLWSGNAALTVAGGAAIFDPAVHRGDREVDLAMARLFGGFPLIFFKGYEASWALPHNHRRRVPLYNLYHLLNHANLFGGGYASQAQRLIDELLADPPC